MWSWKTCFNPLESLQKIKKCFAIKSNFSKGALSCGTEQHVVCLQITTDSKNVFPCRGSQVNWKEKGTRKWAKHFFDPLETRPKHLFNPLLGLYVYVVTEAPIAPRCWLNLVEGVQGKPWLSEKSFEWDATTLPSRWEHAQSWWSRNVGFVATATNEVPFVK